MKENPLKELLVDSEEIDLKRIASALKGVISIDSKSGNIVLKQAFNRLSTKQKVIAYLLGRKSANLLDVADSEEVEPKEIPNATGMLSGTVRPRLKELKDNRIISYSDNGRYYIAPYQIITAIDELE